MKCAIKEQIIIIIIIKNVPGSPQNLQQYRNKVIKVIDLLLLEVW